MQLVLRLMFLAGSVIVFNILIAYNKLKTEHRAIKMASVKKMASKCLQLNKEDRHAFITVQQQQYNEKNT